MQRLSALLAILGFVVAVPAATALAYERPDYLDDRSTPETLLASYANAINLGQYVRAYSYWEPSAAADQLPPYDDFAQGFANTESVEITTGTVTSDVGAGQIYYSVPVALVAKTTSGATQTFVGCYTFHLARPEIQSQPPFQPLGIRSASVQQVPNNADVAAMLLTACPLG